MTAYRLTGRKQWISNGSIADVYSILALAPGGPSWFIVEKGTEGFSTAPPEDKHGIRLSNTAALFLDDVVVPAENLVGRRRGPRTRPGPAGLRLHPGDGRGVRPGRRLGGPGPGDRLLADAGPGRRPAVGEAGLHPQADRAARGAARGGPRVHRGDRDPHRRGRRRRRRAEHRGRDREVPGHRGRQRRRRGGDPGPRRLRLHPALHGREDQARRPDHHHLRGHLGDPGDDDRPRPVAAAPQDRPAPTTATRPRALDGVPERLRRRRRAALALECLAGGAGGLPGRVG